MYKVEYRLTHKYELHIHALLLDLLGWLNKGHSRSTDERNKKLL
jgi:hypothetical protein